MSPTRILESSVAGLDVKDGEFGQRQTNAIAGLKASLGKVVHIVGDLTKPTAVADNKQPAELLDTGRAVLKFWPQNIAPIALAAAVDLICIWYAFMLVFSRAVACSREESLTATPPWLDIANLPSWPQSSSGASSPSPSDKDRKAHV